MEEIFIVLIFCIFFDLLHIPSKDGYIQMKQHRSPAIKSLPTPPPKRLHGAMMSIPPYIQFPTDIHLCLIARPDFQSQSLGYRRR
ncbi:hypothetical protein VTL71DRAFT_12339 [Oculimacula yallundae]|uniref:Secreted protein n=1 Tax=Oculimacula yallundae TaxID=86028 RepID=A0ABR4CPX9_9HELO